MTEMSVSNLFTHFYVEEGGQATFPDWPKARAVFLSEIVTDFVDPSCLPVG